MRVKCVLCDKIEQLDDQLPLAKKLRNRPIHTYMCETCHERIKVQTEGRQSQTAE
ncbi:YlaI family protein [Bacillus suaedae]|uniref:YlaI family protein n=1 Tax=Halalkalibacter suaedae TaxID=2822140 RepID=A0A940WX03_9BACI|nr:YlaI family protein [Bacillus suaedae]MBP3952172.1 YlaI family protein [Bacillus suaedae]